MRSLPLASLLVAAALVWAPAAHAQLAPDAPAVDSAERIIEVRVEGNRRVESEAVRRALKQKVGSTFDASRTADDLRALWALKYFSDVQLLVQRTPKGIAYVVRLSEKPAVRNVVLRGTEELSKDDFKDVIDIKSYSILDVAAVKRNVRKIADKYVEKGFFLAEVTYEVEDIEKGQEVDVIFIVRENAKVEVKEVNFLGVTQLKPDELKAVMGTKESGYLAFFTGEGTYRDELFQRDVQMIQAVYYDKGFINVKVDKAVVTLSPDKRYIYITIRVEEGEAYQVGKLDFSGDLIVDKSLLGLGMVSREGETFNRSTLARDIQSLTDVYYDSGYAYANVTPVTAVNAEDKTIDLTFDVQKGRQVTIERIDIVGNTKTRDKAIRRQLRVFEGEHFSGTGMRRSREKVTALGFFETVEVSHKPGSDDEHVVVTVDIREKSTGTFQVGLGFSNVESFIFTAQVAQQNALGWGVSLSASAQLSGLRSFFQLQYFDPYFLDTNFILSLDAFRTQLDYFGFIRDATGGSASIGRYLVADEMSVNVGYTREWVNIEPGRSGSSQSVRYGNNRSGNTSAVKLSWTWDRRNNRLFPSQGWLSFVSAEFAPGFLGGSYKFNRYTAYQRFYFPLPFGVVFKTNLQAGFMQELNPSPEERLPSSELFYLGGIGTIRGYRLRSVTPHETVGLSADPDSSVGLSGIGGNKQLIFNAELEFPLFEKAGIRGVLFYDAANTFARDANLFQDRENPGAPFGLLHSVGFGFRWFSPIGPLRFEWGIPLYVRPGDESIQFEFNIGNSF